MPLSELTIASARALRVERRDVGLDRGGGAGVHEHGQPRVQVADAVVGIEAELGHQSSACFASTGA